ncbi:M23 family metallopeptidase [Pseudoalteromonas sp. SSM20]|uniref:M23 family metallopeptidase n=1 Tax=Pseudoalteromonas sp. SSM20 TaxID=3139394 RepID=UPI003BAB7868
MLKALFPNKQLLIRQNGDVKYITLPSWLQISLFAVGLTVCIVAGAASYQYVELHKVITAQDKIIEQKQTELDALHLSYREKHSELSNRISQIDEKSQIMTNMLESLPEAQQTEFQTKQEATKQESSKDDKAKSPADTLPKQEKIALTETSEAEPVISLSDDAPVEKETANGDQQKPQTTKPNTENKKAEEESIESDIEKENQQLDAHFAMLSEIVNTRTTSLLKALDKAGVDKDFIMQLELNTSAQGGPFNAIDTSVLTKEQQELLDKIVTLNQLSSNLALLPTSLPAKDFYISSAYGLRTDPISKRRAMHRGIDMAGWHKTKIFAPANGVVKRAGRNGGFGNFIEIEHKNGFVTRYGHLAKVNVKRGQQVQKDQVIGLMGSSGRSTSTHLHYEILHNKKYINPLKLTKAFENVLQ